MICLQQILEILGTLAVILASGVAIYGINSWRKEMKGRKEYELAEEVLALFYEAKDKISAIRSILGIDKEGESRKPNPGETPEEKEALNKAFVVYERYQKYQKLFNRLRALRYRFMAIFGQDKANPFWELNKIINELIISSHMLGKLWHMRRQEYLPRSEEQYNNILKDIKMHEGVFWEGTQDPDPIAPRVENLITEIDKICEPILRRKQGWFSKIFNKTK